MNSLGSVKGNMLGEIVTLILIFPLSTECCDSSALYVRHSFVEMARIIKFLSQDG